MSPSSRVEAEQQRRDRAAAARLPAQAGDDAVGGLVRLHLDDAVTRAGEVGQAEPLRDHAVEARGLQRLQPGSPLLDVGRDRREREAVADALQLGAPLLDRLLVHRLALPEEQVEGDERRRDLGRELAHAALRRVQARLHRVEVELPAARDHDLAVERGVGRQQLAERAQLREVAEQRAPVARPERELAAVVLEHAAKAVPLRLVAPARLCRQLRDELGLHRRERNVRAGRVGHGASLTATGASRMSRGGGCAMLDGVRRPSLAAAAAALVVSRRVERGRASRRAPHRRPRPAGEGHLHVPQRTVPDQGGLRHEGAAARGRLGAQGRGQGEGVRRRPFHAGVGRRSQRRHLQARLPRAEALAARDSRAGAGGRQDRGLRGRPQLGDRPRQAPSLPRRAGRRERRRDGRLTGELPQPGLGTRV